MVYLNYEDCNKRTKEIEINRIINKYINPAIEKAISEGNFDAYIMDYIGVCSDDIIKIFTEKGFSISYELFKYHISWK